MTRRSIALMLCMMAFAAHAVAAELDDIAAHRQCAQCGMDRKAFGYSRMLVVYEDGSSVGLCSVHCVAVELNDSSSKKVKAIMVADRNTGLLAEAQGAAWVMGGDKRGVMTARPKWAFATQSDAQSFVAEHGGAVVTWQEAFDAARADAGLVK